jgi:hypothetical protein
MGATVFYTGSAELATLTNTFQVASVNTDPTTITLVVTDPLGVATTYTYAGGTVTRTSAGVYTKDISCATVGTWSYVWTGTGSASDVVGGTWTVTSTEFGDLYVTPEILKSRKGITDGYDDAEMWTACRAVSRWIDEYCNRVFARRSVTVKLQPCGPYSLSTPDLISVTTLKTDDDGDGVFETTWSAADYELQPVNAALEVQPRPYTSIAAVGSLLFPVTYGTGRRRRAELVGVLGWSPYPAPVTEAAAILGGDYLKLGGMAFGVAGYGDYGAVRARLSTPALSMLDPFRLTPILMA